MKNKRNVFRCLIILLAGVIYFPVQAQQKHDATAVIYQLDVKKSKLLWKAPNNRHNGFILFNSGSLSNFVAGNPTQGTFSIDMNSMRSTDAATAAGRKKVDDELRSEGFFAVSKYPAATIVVSQILPGQDPVIFTVVGKLTIKGLTDAVQFTTTMKQIGGTITATANLTIDRKKWNIDHQPDPSWNPFVSLKDHLVDDEIPVSLELVFTKLIVK